MRIVIAGTGELAAYLAEVLSNESQDIIIVGEDRAALASIDSLSNVLTCCGNPIRVEVLSQLKMKECKLFISLLPKDSDNILACSAAKSLGARITAAKVSDYSLVTGPNTRHFRQLGVDCIVNYEFLAAEETIALLRHPWAKTWAEFFGGELIVAAVRIAEDSPYAGVMLSSFGEVDVRRFHIVLIRRRGQTIIPKGGDVITPGDIVYFAFKEDDVKAVAAGSNGRMKPVKRVVIMGGSEIGIRMCESPKADKFNFKFIEKDECKAEEIQARAPKSTVICGDGSKTDMLEYAGKCDAYVALTKEDEVNILACVTAREMGAGYQMAIVDYKRNIRLSEYLNLDAVINRKQLAANHAFSLLLNSNAPASRAMALADAEIVSVTAEEGAPVTKGAVRDLKIPEDITLAGLMHEGKASLINGNTIIVQGDNVVAVCRSGSIPEVQRLFGS